MTSRLKIAVVGTGISGLSAAWLLSGRHEVTLFEAAERAGGHSNTVLVNDGFKDVPVDTGFIVFNRATYPNLTALFHHLGVRTERSNMSFAVSLRDHSFEYSSDPISGQKHNLWRPRFWALLYDLMRFHKQAQQDADLLALEPLSLGEYLERRGFSRAFRDDCLLPMGSAIWSCDPSEMLNYPASAFIRFQANHVLLQPGQNTVWETVSGGSREYVHRLLEPLAGRLHLNTGVESVQRTPDGVIVTDTNGRTSRFDHVVMASHADQALRVLVDASPEERHLLGPFRYSRNLAVLHSDESLMPKRRHLWASWNYIGTEKNELCVTYWMNKLQNIPGERQYFLTLNPPRAPRAGTLLRSELYEHPLFDNKTLAAQKTLWQLQGQRNTWFCGAYFGAGFHEDGLQAGLAVAEQLGDVKRPWRVPNESGRIVISPTDVLETLSVV